MKESGKTYEEIKKTLSEHGISIGVTTIHDIYTKS